ncbi:hypothetical protein [Geobacter argillaceus]|uniref:Uncharacterized protein n=1 Tax=Geobacter argillaceus TaxID=345631 RepID=A0A562VGD5_9BACT|nr:hypothetical protein [Geobacter argillaceus]TWJ16891.1 hypothetical protein JN12_03250 [Geobacter argillaceus]
MSTTVHRKDMTSADFTLLAKFSRALVNSTALFGKQMVHELPVDYMQLPVWRKTADGWQVAGVRAFHSERIGISVNDFRRICRYLQEKESIVVGVLFRLSMIDVLTYSETTGKKELRQRFPDLTKPIINGVCSWVDDGFVLEKRRALGAFK